MRTASTSTARIPRIAHPARAPADGKHAAWGKDLPQRHGCEDEGEGKDANQVPEVHRRRQQITRRPQARGLLVYRSSGPENLAHRAGQTPQPTFNEARRTPRSTAESGSARPEATATDNVPFSSPSGDRADNARAELRFLALSPHPAASAHRARG